MHHLIYLIPYSFFESCERTFIGAWIGQSKYVFALIETIHIMGLAVLLGTMLGIDLCLLGFGRHWATPAELTKALWPWTMGSLVVMFGTGIPMFLSEATRMSRSAPFYYKMLFLLMAILCQFSFHRTATKPNYHGSEWSGKMIACVSLLCWFGVALGGRAIAFL